MVIPSVKEVINVDQFLNLSKENVTNRLCVYEICFYFCLLGFYMLINVDYTVTYFLPIPSTVTNRLKDLYNIVTCLFTLGHVIGY